MAARRATTTTEYTVLAEFDRRAQPDDGDRLVEALAAVHASAHPSPRGRLTAEFTVPAVDLAQAVVIGHAAAAVAGHPIVSIQVMTTAEAERRAGTPGDIPALVDVAGAAAILGCSTQYIRELLGSGALPHVKVGDRTTVIPQAAVEARRDGKVATAS